MYMCNIIIIVLYNRDYLQHVILSAQIGTRVMRRQISTYNKLYRELSNQVVSINMIRFA